ncbi:MAG: hypothetical protein R2873_08055 [Caldilineaceae bacterium]|nr:hypothetical protein [Caldilineaceae bacterium]
MITIEQVDLSSKAQVRRFIQLPFRLYRHDPRWVPPLLIDVKQQLNKQAHPFYEHSDADFFVAVAGNEIVGRIAVIENRRFNEWHGTHKAHFYFFECEDDHTVAGALFAAAADWAQRRGLNMLIGPKGLGPMDGYGMLIEGFEQRQMMTTMNYNLPYFVPLVEGWGFEKEVDFLSCYANSADFHLPERVRRIAERVERRGELRVQRFTSTKELRAWAPRIGEAYNKAFVNNWEYHPLTPREVQFVLDSVQSIADPRLIKIIVHGEDVVGFLFAFPDIAHAIQRSRGRLFPFGIVDMLISLRTTRWIAVNAAGILPEFQGRGGNALLYNEIEKTVRSRRFEHGALYQVAETAVNMRRDLENLGGIRYKNHRVYRRGI